MQACVAMSLYACFIARKLAAGASAVSEVIDDMPRNAQLYSHLTESNTKCKVSLAQHLAHTGNSRACRAAPFIQALDG